MFARILNNVWIGSVACTDPAGGVLQKNNINIVINLSGSALKNTVPTVEYYDSLLPSEELMDDEIPRIEKKIMVIVEKLKLFVAEKYNVLVCCSDGLNKSPLIVGYYMMLTGGKLPDVLHKLQHAYGPDHNCLTMQSYQKILKLKSPNVKKVPISNYCYHRRTIDE